MNRILLLAAWVSVFSLNSVFARADSPPERRDEDNLTRAVAEFRASQVKSVAYDLSFDLEKGAKTYRGKTRIALSLNRTDAPLSVDFFAAKAPSSVVVNATNVTDLVLRKGSFDIPAKYLKPESQIEIDYESDFNQSPTGFYRMVDPIDKKEYLYTDFEPYQAHMLFPCLDQPDLKAKFQVRVNAPESWKVISNGLPKRGAVTGAKAVTEFKFDLPISTYLFFLGAGDYKEWTDHYGKLPLYLYARQSLAKNVDARAIFDLTKKGLTFYAKYFGKEYPFPKYGHVFIPDFMWGGMENPGAITVSERYIFRGQATDAEIRDRAGLVSHEMAHMWFGDLVTLKWWNDTWLNEAFATFMSSLCQAEAYKDPGAWNDAFSEKSWGYWQDSLVTTHPIEAPIVDTLNARGNFDGITYAKGAAALRQLRYFVGPEKFQKGVQSYFQKFGGSNTTREDFVREIAQAAGTSLDEWTHAWLQTAGPNRVNADWKCDGGKIASFRLKQEANAGGILSPHRTRISLFNRDSNGKLAPTRVEAVSYQDAMTEVPTLVGAACPDFVYPNDGDEDYALVSLDPVSLSAAQSGLSQLPGSLLRLMTWETLSQMIRDGKLKPSEYMKTVLEALKTEGDETILGVLLGRHSPVRENYFTYLTPPARAKTAPEFESLIWNRASEAPAGSSLRLTFFDFAVAISRTPESQKRLTAILDGTSPLLGGKLDQDRRWSVLTALARSGVAGSEKLIGKEALKDGSSRGRGSAYAARVALPEAQGKEKAWTDLITPGALDEQTFNSSKRWFQDPNRPELEIPFVDKFFKAVSTMDWSNEVHRDRVEGYFDSLFPDLCTSELLGRSEREIKAATAINDAVRRAWLEMNDMLGRCVRARGLD